MEITKKDRSTLKTYFSKNAMPTSGHFAELIDGLMNQKDDGLAKPSDGPLSLQADGDNASQKKAINFYRNFSDSGPVWTLSLNPRDKADTAKPGWNIADANGNSRFFIDQSTGNVGLGTVDPGGYKLNVQGTALFTGNASFNGGASFGANASFTGNGSFNGNFGVGTGTDAPAGKLEVRTGGSGTWDRFVVKTTNLWGDGDKQYVTIGEGGAAGIMFYNPHVVWFARENRASIRMGRSGGTASGHWWDIGVRADNIFSILDGDSGVTGLAIDSAGQVSVGSVRTTGGLTVASGQTVKGIPVVDFQSQYQEFARHKDSAKKITYTFTFSRPVLKAEPMLKGWFLNYSNREVIKEISVSCGNANISGNSVKVDVTFAMKDLTGNYDDEYWGNATVVVVAHLSQTL